MVDDEVCVRLANGCTVYSGWSDHDDPVARVSGDYLRLEDPCGRELLYYDSDQWLGQPENTEVIGAFINACAGVLSPNSQVRYDYLRTLTRPYDAEGRPANITLAQAVHALEYNIRHGNREDAIGLLFDILHHVTPGYRVVFDTATFNNAQEMCDHYGKNPIPLL